MLTREVLPRRSWLPIIALGFISSGLALAFAGALMLAVSR